MTIINSFSIDEAKYEIPSNSGKIINNLKINQLGIKLNLFTTRCNQTAIR